ncbi:hypothetical protein V7S43_004929 [Phytophthora oleae]|uniref:Uncharacterized protein n=1 Tax=Phytophthora oleae TaxID=2107226 RepID=A0ABD3FTE4_9STRA
MHPFCGRPTGNEGFAQPIICPTCDQIAPPALPKTPTIDVAAQEESDTSVELEVSEPALPLTRNASRHTQNVSSIAHRRKVVRWIKKHEATKGSDGMFAQAVSTFPSIFNSSTRAANLAKALDWWAKRELFWELNAVQSPFQCVDDVEEDGSALK